MKVSSVDPVSEWKEIFLMENSRVFWVFFSVLKFPTLMTGGVIIKAKECEE